MTEYRVMVFGKKGCSKCSILNKRVDKILQKPEWSNFEKMYYDISTVDGLVHFANAECLKANSVPAFLVCRGVEDNRYVKIRQTFDEGHDEQTGRYRVPSYVGLQTDYRSGGVITPTDIEAVFTEAKAGA